MKNGSQSNFILILIFLFVFLNCNPSGRISGKSLNHIPEKLIGNFIDDYNITYSIIDTIWIQHTGAKYHLLKYDNDGQYFIARNDETNPVSAGLFTRIDVMQFQNMEPWIWGFCLTAYDAKTFIEAEAAMSADRNNPKKGCGGFPFSRMKKN